MTCHSLFLVLSSGYCGSLWLAQALDRHPDVSCSCSLVGLSIPHDGGFDFSKHDPGEIDAMMRALGINSIDEHFDRVLARKSARAAGDVHGWRVSSYREAIASRPHRPAALAHLVRHPITLLERITQEQVHRFHSFPRIRQSMMELFPRLCQAYQPVLAGMEWDFGADGYRSLGFLSALNEIVLVLNDMEQGADIPLWPFEELTSSRDAFRRLVDTLTGGAVTATPAYLDAIFDPSALDNSGRYRKTGIDRTSSPADIFGRWSPQEQEAFRRIARLRLMPDLYRSVGYDFDFIEP